VACRGLPAFLGTICFDEGPHLNPLPPGRGLALIMLRGGSAASAFIQPAMVLIEQWLAAGWLVLPDGHLRGLPCSNIFYARAPLS